MYSACYNVLRLFEMMPRLGFNRCASYGLFASLLAFEAKVELTKPKPVLASLRPAHSWYTFPAICGVGLQQKLRSMAQDKQSL